METSLAQAIEAVCDLALAQAKTTSRVIIGIAGPPAAGKSTLAEAVVRKLNADAATGGPTAALLPMDGYHLDNRILQAHGTLARKGAPHTFDSVGFCQAVQNLADQASDSFHPRFDRDLDLAIANAICIEAETPIVVVEGNYLLLKDDPWQSLRHVFATSVFIRPPMEVLTERLHQRWIDHGLDPQAALARATQNDLPNAQLVIEQSGPADLYLQQT